MKQIKEIFSFLLILLIYNSIDANKLPLPASLANLPIHYEEVEQIDGISCGYNALYNACKLETKLGIINPASNLDYFTTICLPYLNSINANPMADSSNEIIENLACLLKLQNFRYLSFDKDYITIPSLVITFVYPEGASQAEIDRREDRARIEQPESAYNHLVAEFNSAKGLYCIHFICHVKSSGVDHAVLASVAKDINGQKSIYIHDNVNEQITEQCDIVRYINMLRERFDIQPIFQSRTMQAQGSSSSNIAERLTRQEKQELDYAIQLSLQEEEKASKDREYIQLELEYFKKLEQIKIDEELAKALQLSL